LATSSENVFYSLLNLRKVKPVVVAIDTLAVSGGYYMAVAGNRIYAPSSSYIGNVGTRGPRPSDPAISPDELSSGPFKLTGGNRFDRIQQLDVVKDAFVGNVVYQRSNAEMNPLKIDAEAVAEARIYLGSEAVAVGLIDREGSLSDAIAATAELAGVESYRTVDLAGYFGYDAATPVAPIQESIRSMVENASAEAIFLLDSRIPLPGVLESTELDQHLLRLRSVDAGTLNPTQSQSPGSLQSPFR
jgi:protease-4